MEIQKKESFFLRKEGDKIVNENNTLGTLSNHDWYIDLILRKSMVLDGYVQINRDDFIYEIERQIINPYFYELGFFETIKQVGYNSSTLDYFYNLILTGNTSDVSPELFNSIYNLYKDSIELKSTFYNIPIAPEPVNNMSAITVTQKLIEIKRIVEENQKSFALEQTGSTQSIDIIKTIVVKNEGDYVFIDGFPVPLNTKLDIYKDGKIYVSEGIYKNYQVYKTLADTLESSIQTP
jgi:hypothetical protein